MPRPLSIDPAAAVGEQGDVDPVRVARQGLVDRVVDDLVDEVMEARRTGRADVHTGPLADRLETLENRDVLGRVRHASTPSCGLGSEPLSACCAHPVPARERPGQRGCIRFLQCTRTGPPIGRSGPCYDRIHGPVATPPPALAPAQEPLTTTRIAVTTPGPQHASARSTSWCSAYRSWVAQPGSVDLDRAHAVAERAHRTCGASSSPTTVGHASESVENASAGGIPNVRPTASSESRSEHGLVGVAAALAHWTRPAWMRSTWSGSTSAGIAPAVVSSVWPGRQVRAPARSTARRRAR